MARTRKIRKKKSQKDREVLYNDNSVIDIDKEREARRLELRKKAEAKQRRTGRKSLKEEMMEEIEIQEHPDRARMPKTAAAKPPRKKAFTAPQRLLLILLVLLLIVFAVSVRSIVMLKHEERTAEKEVAELKIQKAELQKKVGDLDSDEYIEQQARNWLKMARQGDMVYVMKGDSIEQNSNVTREDEEANAGGNEEDQNAL